MLELREGDKREVIVSVSKRGGGTVTLTTPQRRILDGTRTLVAGFDWAAATWDGTAAELFTLFDSTAEGLTAPGTYYVQLRGTIGNEVYETEVLVRLLEWGP